MIHRLCTWRNFAYGRLLKFIISHYFGTWYFKQCVENKMSVAILSVCQFMRNMIRGIILNIETFKSYYVPRKYYHRFSVQMSCTRRRNISKFSVYTWTWPITTDHMFCIRQILRNCRIVRCFGKIAKESLLCFSYLPVCPSACSNSAPTRWIFIKIAIWVFLDNLYRKNKFI